MFALSQTQTETTLLSKVESDERFVDDLEQLLMACYAQQQTLTYQRIKNELHIDPQFHENRYLVKKAKDRLDDKGITFRTLRQIGFKPLTHGEGLKQAGKDGRSKVKVAVKKWGNKFKRIDPHKLNQAELEIYIREGLSYQRHEDLTSSETEEKIEIAASTISDPLSPANLKKMLLLAKEEMRSLG